MKALANHLHLLPAIIDVQIHGFQISLLSEGLSSGHIWIEMLAENFSWLKDQTDQQEPAQRLRRKQEKKSKDASSDSDVPEPKPKSGTPKKHAQGIGKGKAKAEVKSKGIMAKKRICMQCSVHTYSISRCPSSLHAIYRCILMGLGPV